MVGYLAVTDDVLAACHLVGKNRRQQVFGCHALQLRSDFVPTAKPQQRKRKSGVPAPARAEHRRVEQRLHQQWPYGGRG